MNLFVIGGTGFISGALVRHLLENGHQVTTFTRGSTSTPAPHERLVEQYGDRRRRGDLERAAGNTTYDAVFDMIAYEADESELAAGVFKGKTRRFIHCSTISVYTVSDELRCPITEDQARLPEMKRRLPHDAFGHQYGLDKRRCEEVLWSRHDPDAFPVTMLRPTFVCGPADRSQRDWFWIERILDGSPLLVPGSGDHAFQSIYVEDLAFLFAGLLDHPQTIGKAYNAVGEEIFTLNTYLDRLCKLLDRDPERIPIDEDVFDRLDLSSNPHGDVFPFDTRRTAIFSLDRTKRDLDYRSTNFDEWMAGTIDWFRSRQARHSLGYERRDEEVDIARRWHTGRRSLAEQIRTTLPYPT